MTTLTRTFSKQEIGTTGSLTRALLATDASPAHALLRVVLGVVLLAHGAQHLLGWFGGYGFTGTMAWMTGTVGIPAPFAAAGILLEFFGPIFLILGLGARLVGIALAVFMATAASTHLANGFFMNWFGTMPAGIEGFEYHLLAVAMALVIAFHGAGAFSLDRVIARRLPTNG